ncbi:MAG: helix-turn-helix transcriptional regulator [Neisseriaceae bacterium]|nr:helix-turn-helix transcriptional regulator [Neisseriaceae bacterium]
MSTEQPLKSTAAPQPCPVAITSGVIGGKWKGVVLFHLLTDTRRFNELKRLMPGVTQRMLTKQLRELEADGVVSRTVYAVVPPRVEYALTPFGQTLSDVIISMRAWGIAHAGQLPQHEAPGAD